MTAEDEFIYTTDLIRNLFAAGVLEHGGGVEQEANAAFDHWLTAHDAEIRTAALEDAGRDLLRGIGIQSTNGIGWIPTDSLRGAGRYLLHISHAAKEDKP